MRKEQKAKLAIKISEILFEYDISEGESVLLEQDIMNLVQEICEPLESEIIALTNRNSHLIIKLQNKV